VLFFFQTREETPPTFLMRLQGPDPHSHKNPKCSKSLTGKYNGRTVRSVQKQRRNNRLKMLKAKTAMRIRSRIKRRAPCFFPRREKWVRRSNSDILQTSVVDPDM
jgi:hypothetical protein